MPPPEEVRHTSRGAGRRRRSDGRIGTGPVVGYRALGYVGAPEIALTDPTRLSVVQQGQIVNVQGVAADPSVRAWRLYVGDGTAPTRRDYRRIASGRGPISGTIAQWNVGEEPAGVKTLKLEVIARVAQERPRVFVYPCG